MPGARHAGFSRERAKLQSLRLVSSVGSAHWASYPDCLTKTPIPGACLLMSKLTDSYGYDLSTSNEAAASAAPDIRHHARGSRCE